MVIALRLVRRPDGVEPGLGSCSVAAGGSTIGRAPECDLVLDDPFRLVSRRHAWLVPQGADEALLRCVSTSAALLVNGEALPPDGERLVRPGDRLRIGGFEVLLEQREPLAAAAPLAAPPIRLGRLDRWFDLDTVADPLGPGSPLPALDGVGPLERTRKIARTDPAIVDLRVHSPAARQPMASRAQPQAMANAIALELAQRESTRAAPPLRTPAAQEPALTELETLRRAFLRGAGLDAAAPFALGPAEMEHLGALLRASTEGMLGLLRSRAVAESSLPADGTRIVARENNPLKFVPDVAQALALLLDLKSRRGFLDPVDAVRDAHDELQVHQLAVVAGMRAAVFDLISQLGPEAIEAARGPARGFSQRLPALRDAALWRRHRQGHARLLENLDDVLESTFDREFLRAYEARSKWAEEAAPSPDGRDSPHALRR